MTALVFGLLMVRPANGGFVTGLVIGSALSSKSSPPQETQIPTTWAQCPGLYGVYKCYLSSDGGLCGHDEGCGYTYRTFRDSLPPGATIVRVDLDASADHALIQYCRRAPGKRP